MSEDYLNEFEEPKAERFELLRSIFHVITFILTVIGTAFQIHLGHATLAYLLGFSVTISIVGVFKSIIKIIKN